MKYCFVFVCQGGRLEWMASLLAASLKYHVRCQYALVAAIPNGPEVVAPGERTLGFLEQLSVRTIPIHNPINADYPIGHKLSCIDIQTDATKLVFLDSDVLCTREFHHHPQFENAPFLAKLTDMADLSMNDWSTICRTLGRPVPSRLFKSTVTNEDIPLCFNSGVIALDAGTGLGARWIEIARSLDRRKGVPGVRPFLDQITLPFAVADIGLDYQLLEEAYNFPAEIRPINLLSPPYFSHYHHLSHLLAEPFKMALLQRLADRFEGLLSIALPAPLLALLQSRLSA
jgi:hypothetical protein